MAKSLRTQHKQVAVRSKYGPKMKAAPLVIKSLETGEVLEVHKKGRITKLPSPAEIKAAKTRRGGWTRATLASWGVGWPPPRGWRRRLEAEWRALNDETAPPPKG